MLLLCIVSLLMRRSLRILLALMLSRVHKSLLLLLLMLHLSLLILMLLLKLLLVLTVLLVLTDCLLGSCLPMRLRTSVGGGVIRI